MKKRIRNIGFIALQLVAFNALFFATPVKTEAGNTCMASCSYAIADVIACASSDVCLQGDGWVFCNETGAVQC